jgi:ribosomal protein S18 acetylase RimI-like enzyme
MMSFLTRIRLRLRYPWLPPFVHQRLQPLRFARLTARHIPECLDLYDRNVAHGLPADHREAYREALESGDILTLVAETEEGKLAGTFGVQFGFQSDVVWLCYVMVAPEQHRHGIGATLWLASLALQRGPHVTRSLAVSAVPRALGFYERLGFVQVGETPHTNGDLHPLAVFSPVTEQITSDSRRILEAAGATLPYEPLVIPHARTPEQAQPMPAAG